MSIIIQLSDRIRSMSCKWSFNKWFIRLEFLWSQRPKSLLVKTGPTESPDNWDIQDKNLQSGFIDSTSSIIRNLSVPLLKCQYEWFLKMFSYKVFFSHFPDLASTSQHVRSVNTIIDTRYTTFDIWLDHTKTDTQRPVKWSSQAYNFYVNLLSCDNNTSHTQFKIC